MELVVTRADGTQEGAAGPGRGARPPGRRRSRGSCAALAPFGEGIGAGEVVIPGAMARAVSVQAGDRVTAVFTDLGEISASFVDGAGA
jgi:hypothetical protein